MADPWVIEDPYGEGLTFVPTGEWTADTSAALVESGVANLEINTARGYRSPSLEFIRDWPIRRLLLLDIDLVDLSPLQRLRSLQELRIEAADDAELDLGELPGLKVLGVDWRSVRDSIDTSSPGLRAVKLSGYTGSDLGGLASLARLESLDLVQPRALETLAGVGSPSLRRLSVAYARRLGDLRALSEPEFETLEALELEACPQVQDLTPVAALHGLRRIAIVDCKQVDSIAPLRGLRDLEVVALGGSTVIGDDDLSVLLDLPRLREVRVADRRSYRPRRSAIEEHVSAQAAAL
jgi:hypothetical protein